LSAYCAVYRFTENAAPENAGLAKLMKDQMPGLEYAGPKVEKTRLHGVENEGPRKSDFIAVTSIQHCHMP